MGKSIDVVNKFYDVANNKKGEGLEDLVSDNISFEGPLMNLSGAKQYIETVKPLCQMHQGMQMFKQIEDGDHVVSIYEMTLGTPNGGTMKAKFADWIRIENGKVAEQKLFYDPREFAKAFNM